MVEEEVQELIALLEKGEITKEEFQRRMDQLVEVKPDSRRSSGDSTRLDEISSAARMARSL